MKKIQIISSALNEESNIEQFFRELRSLFELEPDYSWEVLLFDNASSDRTWEIICKCVKEDSRFKGFRMSRTFTLDASLTAGIDMADGDAVITMASDLQDQPLVIRDFLRLWESGDDLVLARITKRADLNFTMRFFTPLYYKIASWASNGMLYKDVSDFRLMSKVVYENVRKLQERHRYMRGITAWTGFSPSFVDVERPSRFGGKTNNKFFPVFNLASRGILAQSEKAINFISVVGIITPFISGVASFMLVISWVFFGVPFAGYGSLVVLIIFLFSLAFMFLGKLAQYISLIYLETRARPNYLIHKVANELQ